MPRLDVQKIGQAAHKLLGQGLDGKVLAVFSNAAYLHGAQEELFWLAPKSVSMHRRCLQISGPIPRLTAGSPFCVKDQRLRVGSEASFDFSRACIWKSPRLSVGDATAIHALPERVCTIFADSAYLLYPKGFGQLIPGILSLAQSCHTAHSPPRSATILAIAWPAVRAIAQACLAHDTPRILEQSEALVGLGEGLTPSGDDFVGGLLLCMTALQSVYPHTVDPAFTGRSDLIEKSESSTNLISFTILKDHADGHTIDTLHQFVNALLTNQPSDSIYRLVLELVRIGHSTGWDLLAGVLTGLLLTFRVSEPVP